MESTKSTKSTKATATTMYAAATEAVSFVSQANYDERERAANSWLCEIFEGTTTLGLQAYYDRQEEDKLK